MSLETRIDRLEITNRRYRNLLIVGAVIAAGAITLAMRQPAPRDPFVSLQVGNGTQYMYGLTMSGQLYQMDHSGPSARRWFKVGDR